MSQKSDSPPASELSRLPLMSPVYANMPLYLKYDNENGLDNLTAVIVNGIQDPIPEGTVYAEAPVFLSYNNENGLANIAAVEEASSKVTT